MGCHSHPQGIFLTQGLNQGLPHCRQILYHLSHQLLDSLNDRHLIFLTAWDAGSLRSGYQHDQALVRALLMTCRQLPSHCVLTRSFLDACVWIKEALMSLPLLIRTLISLWGPTLKTSSKPNRLPKVPSLISPYCWLWLQHMNWSTQTQSVTET